jgi:hypothetical protein
MATKGVYISNELDRTQFVRYLLTEEQIELFNTKDFSSSNKRIEQLFYKFAADIFYKSEPSPNSLLKEANLSVRGLRNADEDDFSKDYPDVEERKRKPKELENLIKLIMKKIGKTKLHTLIEKLAAKGYFTIYNESKEQKKKKLTYDDSKYIFTVALLNRAKELNFLTSQFTNEKRVKQLLEETYDKPKLTSEELKDMKDKIKEKILDDKDVKRESLSSESEKDDFDRTLNEEIEERFEEQLATLEEVDSEVGNYGIIDSFDKGKPIYIPELLLADGVITTNIQTTGKGKTTTESSIEIVIDTKKYFKLAFKKAGLDANILGDKSKYNIQTVQEDTTKEKSDIYQEWLKKISNNNEKITYLTTLLDTTEEEEETNNRIKEIFGVSNSKFIIMLLKDLSDGTDNFEKRILRQKRGKREGGSFEVSVLREILDNIDDVLAEKTKDTDQEDEEDIEKQLLKSVLKTITFLKKEDFSGLKDFFEPSFSNGILVLERIFSDLDQKNNTNSIETPAVEKYNVLSSLTGSNYIGITKSQAYAKLNSEYNKINDNKTVAKLITEIISSNKKINSASMYDIKTAIESILRPQNQEIMMGKYRFTLAFTSKSGKEALKSKEKFEEYLNYDKDYGIQLATATTGKKPNEKMKRLLYNKEEIIHPDINTIYDMITDDIIPFQNELHRILQKESYYFTKSPREIKEISSDSDWDDAAFNITTSLFNTSGRGQSNTTPEKRIRTMINVSYRDFKNMNNLMNDITIKTKNDKIITSQNIEELRKSKNQEDIDNLFLLYSKYISGLSSLGVPVDSDEMNIGIEQEVAEENTENAKEIFDEFKETEAYKWFTSEEIKRLLLPQNSYSYTPKPDEYVTGRNTRQQTLEKSIKKEEFMETDIFPSWFDDGYQGYYKNILRGNFQYNNVDLDILKDMIKKITEAYENKDKNKGEVLRKYQLSKITKMFVKSVEEIESVDEIKSLFFWLKKTDRDNLVGLFENFLLKLEDSELTESGTKKIDKIKFESFKKILNLGSLLRENRQGKNSYNMVNIERSLTQLFIEEILPNKRGIPKLEIKNKDNKLIATLPRGMIAGLGKIKYIPFISYNSKTSEELKLLSPLSAMSGDDDIAISGFGRGTNFGSSRPSKVGSKSSSMNDNTRILSATSKYKLMVE